MKQMNSDIKEKDIIAVWFSCGAASAVAAKKTIEQYGETHIIRVINNPIKEEHDDNRRFLKDVEKWLGIEIEIAINKDWQSFSAYDVWEKRKYMEGIGGAPCTQQLKKEARRQWEDKNHHDHLVLGFTFDEVKRSKRFILTERSNVIEVLIDNKLTKADCFKIIQDAGIELPEIYKLGYPNANCIGCVKATSPTYWNHVRKVHPEIFKQRAEQSERIGCRLVRYKGKRTFLSELPPEAKGRPMKTLKMPDCGIFCEEKL